jgi:hypothetical protein
MLLAHRVFECHSQFVASWVSWCWGSTMLQGVEGEPEARRVAREKRLAAKQAAIDTARQEMQMREAASEEEKSQKVGGTTG